MSSRRRRGVPIDDAKRFRPRPECLFAIWRHPTLKTCGAVRKRQDPKRAKCRSLLEARDSRPEDRVTCPYQLRQEQQKKREVPPFEMLGKEYDPSDIASFYVAYLLQYSILQRGNTLDGLTVTVPGSFTTRQRQDTVTAITKACDRSGVHLSKDQLRSTESTLRTASHRSMPFSSNAKSRLPRLIRCCLLAAWAAFVSGM